MNNHVKNQHYVPQFLLKNFSSREKKFIWAYDKNEKYSVQNQIKERPIKKVASEEYFHDQNENILRLLVMNMRCKKSKMKPHQLFRK